MISQETKDQIEKEALIEYPLVYGKYTHEGDYMTTGFDVNAYNRANFIRFSTKYAERLEEKDKAYNKLGVKFDKEVERWQERDANEVEKRRVLESEIERLKYDLDASVKALVETCKKQDRELAQLKEIAEKMNKDIKAMSDPNQNFDDAFDKAREDVLSYESYLKQSK